jgi:hypothetical protein
MMTFDLQESRSVTRAARKVLDDCKFILSKLEDETDDQQWRIHWVAVVTLLRAVGHVLTKVDGQSEPIRLAAGHLFRAWKSNDPAHEIFREFIEKERNSVIKEYAMGVSEGPVPVVISFEDPATGELTGYELNPIGENLYRPMAEGLYEGEDGRTLIELAIDWWEEQLAEVDRVSMNSGGPY